MKNLILAALLMLCACQRNPAVISTPSAAQDYQKVQSEIRRQDCTQEKTLSMATKVYSECFGKFTSRYKKSNEDPNFVAIAVADECAFIKPLLQRAMVEYIVPPSQCGKQKLGATDASILANQMVDDDERKLKQRTIKTLVKNRLK